MKIKKGDTFRCVKDVAMSDGSIAYKKGKIYVSEQYECITDEEKSKDHYWDSNEIMEHFAFIPEIMQKNNTMAEVYKNSSDNIKQQLREKFSDEELGLKFVPKNGDIVAFDWDGDKTYNSFAIVKRKAEYDPFSYYIYVCLNKYNTLMDNDWLCLFNARLATEEERQKLFDRMKEQGLQWNEKEKKVEKVRWRAKKGERYFHIGADLEIGAFTENNDAGDLILYNRNNYFQTKEQAEIKADKIRKIFMEE